MGAVCVLASCSSEPGADYQPLRGWAKIKEPFEAFPRADYKPHDRRAVVPQDFLFTTHKPMNEWLDTPVYVQLTEVPLSQVFSQPVLSKLNTRLVNMPPDDPRITMYRTAISRRQLLWSLSQDHKLTMIPHHVPNGSSFVEIRGRKS